MGFTARIQWLGSWDKRGNGMHGDKWWKCQNCAADNKSKTACAICGLRRSYADVAKQAVDQSPKKKSGRQAGKPRSSTPGGRGIQACSGSCRKGLSPTYGCADERVGLQSWQGEAGQTGSGIESNARRRREFREREKCDNREDCRDKNRHGLEQAYWCAYRRGQTTLDTSAAGSCGSLGDSSAGRRVIRRGDRMYRMRVARFGSCACTRPAVPADICTDNTVDAVSAQLQRLLNILKKDPGVDPNLVSLATARSAQLITIARSSSRPPEEDTWEAISESAPTSATHVNQNEGSQTNSWRGRSRRMRRDFGLTNEREVLLWQHR